MDTMTVFPDLDHAVRRAVPWWLNRAGLDELAAILQALPPVTPETAGATQRELLTFVTSREWLHAHKPPDGCWPVTWSALNTAAHEIPALLDVPELSLNGPEREIVGHARWIVHDVAMLLAYEAAQEAAQRSWDADVAAYEPGSAGPSYWLTNAENAAYKAVTDFLAGVVDEMAGQLTR